MLAATFEQARKALNAGDLASAEARCRAAGSAQPAQAWPWAMLSEIALRRNDAALALAHAQKSIALDPGLLLGRVMEAKSLLQQGDYAAARLAARAAAGRADAPPEAIDGLGAVFGMLGEHRTALTLFQRATAAAPAVPQFLFNRAATERMTGDLAAAETHCDTAIARDRHFYLAHYLRADLRIQTRARNHIAELSQLLDQGALPASGEVMLRFALAKEYEDLEEHAYSFGEVRKAAVLHRRHLIYDVAQEIAAIDRIVRTQTRAWLAAAPPGDNSAAPVFVMGLPRSGTTVVERIVASHSAIASAGETGIFAAQVARALRRLRGDGASPPRRLDPAALGRDYLDTLAAATQIAAPRFIDKTLQNYLYCGWIHAALPRAKMILVHRHPLDLGYALYKTHFLGTFPFSYDLAELADYILAFRRLVAHWRSMLPPAAFMEIAYEDIVRDQEGQSRKLLAFLGLAWEDGVLRFHESRMPSATASAVQVRRPLYSSAVGRWRHHAVALEPLRQRLAHVLPREEPA